MFDISDIDMIKVISEVGSVNKAAELLNVSQPTLSKKVKRLESKVKMALFNRDNVGMVPTEAAKLLLREGEDLRTQLNIIQRKLELMSRQVGGRVKIGVGPIIEQVILPKALLDFAEKDYQFGLSVVTLSQQALIEQLRKSEIDIAIGPFSADEIPEEFVAPLKTSENIVLVARPGHPLCAKTSLSLDALVTNKVVTPNIPKSMGNHVMSLIRGLDLEPDIICENYSMAKTIVANSNYITAGPESLFRKELSLGELERLEFNTEVNWQCHCLVKPENMLAPIVKEVIGIFEQYMLAADA